MTDFFTVNLLKIFILPKSIQNGFSLSTLRQLFWIIFVPFFLSDFRHFYKLMIPNTRLSTILLTKNFEFTSSFAFLVAGGNSYIWVFSCPAGVPVCRPGKIQLGSRISESAKGRNMKFGIRVANGVDQVPLWTILRFSLFRGRGGFFVEFFAVFSNLIGKSNLGKGKGFKSEIRYQGSQPRGPSPSLDDFAIFTF